MKFLYGRADWATRERGEENCYLLTNGLGGFSSSTMIGSSARCDHSFFMACTKAPNHRYSMIHRLEEVLEAGGRSVHLSAQRYADSSKDEEGYRFLDGFCFADYPRWTYHVDGTEVVKEIAMEQGANTIAVRYCVENRTAGDVFLRITPHLQFCPKGEQPEKGQMFVMKDTSVTSNGLELFFETNGEAELIPVKYVTGLYYAYDARDGRRPLGSTYVNHWIGKKVAAGKQAVLEIVYYMERAEDFAHTDSVSLESGRRADQIFREAVRYRKALAQACGMKSEAAQMLAKSAGQFVARRDFRTARPGTVQGENRNADRSRDSVGGKTLLAGFPFFGDWGRDTMIAVAGCCISTNQTETAKSILRTFASCCREGLMPNLFPEGENEPLYNTVDASLLFINAVYLYYEKTGDLPFVREVWRTMREIIGWYRKGTAYGIRMDEDGLLMAGEKLDQVTWMDVRIGDILPTPRHGKPVEVNAYWYNALRVMELFRGILQKEGGEGGILREEGVEYGVLAEQVRKTFCEKFWNEEKACLKDLLSGTAADGQIRCNQIWAVSLPFCALDDAHQKQVVDKVFEKLYTPYGLRTLAKDDPEFRGTYKGPQAERDLAYHQGTVWVFPLGAYYLSRLKTEGYSREALEMVRRQLEPLEAALREGCIGQLPEIYDGEAPSFSRGCFAQAWSVGEILRVYEALEKEG